MMAFAKFKCVPSSSFLHLKKSCPSFAFISFLLRKLDHNSQIMIFVELPCIESIPI